MSTKRSNKNSKIQKLKIRVGISLIGMGVLFTWVLLGFIHYVSLVAHINITFWYGLSALVFGLYVLTGTAITISGILKKAVK